MLHVATIAEVRAACDAARAAGRRVGLVPTMGFLHEGHRSLMRAARAGTDFVVVTIFVNPLQFGAGEDLDRYPRDVDGDLEQCRAEGVDLVFAPPATEMYPDGVPLTTVHVDGLTSDLCGTARPVHFDGVTTVVAKLFAIVGPCTAYFGRKDAQQLAVVARRVDDLDLPVEVVGCPLVREPDGLARSSRNAYLTPADRSAALVLSRALETAAAAVVAGERDAEALRATIRRVVASEPDVQLEYVEVRHARDLTPFATPIEGDVLVALAAHVGGVRLIDNFHCSVRGTEVSVDLGVGSGTGSRESEGAVPCTAR
jgi:pantoate--beta-alanine ligase